VATRVGGIPEVVEHESSGLLVPPGDALALAEAVESLIKNPARRLELGAAAKVSAVTRFTPEVIVPQYEALYERVGRT
jgi:glycosyltransferase involved in cell wall biosynthesis